MSMPFDSGSVSFTICKIAHPIPSDLLNRFDANKAHSLASVLDEPQYGWVSGRHLLEERIDDLTAFAGGYLHLNLRIAQRKVPSSLFKARCAMHELAVIEERNLDYVPRKQRKEIREMVKDDLLKEVPPTLKGLPFVLDANGGWLYLGATSQKQVELFFEHFYTAMGFEPVPLTPALAAESLFNISEEALAPLDFAAGAPAAAEPTPGRDFLTWLWYSQEAEGGMVEIPDYGQFAFMLDGPLVFAADGQGALETVVRKGNPTQSAEAQAALRVGKKLRQAKLVLARDKESWTCTLDADEFTFRSLSLPNGEEMDAGSQFQERVMFLAMFRQVFFELYRRYTEIAVDPGAVRRHTDAFAAWVEERTGR
jgi:hypothetical protein